MPMIKRIRLVLGFTALGCDRTAQQSVARQAEDVGGTVVVPERSTGATDRLYVRNAGVPVYGGSTVFERINDIRAHGRDERIGVKAYHDAAQYWHQLVKTLAAGQET